jgi:phosphoglycolate phosphatase
MAMIKNIIFDFDGTLVDSNFTVDKLFEHFKNKYKKIDIEKIDFRKMNGLSLGQKFKKIGIPLYRVPEIVLEARRIYPSYIDKIKMNEGIPELLEKLNKLGLELNILSSNSIKNIKSFLEIKNIGFFSDVYSSSNILKKDKALIKLMKIKKLSSETILYIGDELNDIIACKKASVKVLAVTWGLDPIDSLENGKPDCICNRPMEIYDYIYKNNFWNKIP